MVTNAVGKMQILQRMLTILPESLIRPAQRGEEGRQAEAELNGKQMYLRVVSMAEVIIDSFLLLFFGSLAIKDPTPFNHFLGNQLLPGCTLSCFYQAATCGSRPWYSLMASTIPEVRALYSWLSMEKIWSWLPARTILLILAAMPYFLWLMIAPIVARGPPFRKQIIPH